MPIVSKSSRNTGLLTIDEFSQALMKTDESNLLDFCRKYVLHGTPHIFSHREDDFYEFRKTIAERFHIQFHEIYITGSAKLGFSPLKRRAFSFDSDVDVAIVSTTLFDSLMTRIHAYQLSLRTNRRHVTETELLMYHRFLEYVALGWFRPDLLPTSFKVDEFKKDWFDFFDTVSYGRSHVGNYKVSCGVFSSYKHLELYTLACYQSIRNASLVRNSK